jgi:hypothetical protein
MMNNDFYPTPAPLIRRMLEGVSLDELSYVLEPSAGKGDMCDYLIEQRYRRNTLDIDAIEIEPELRATLKGKGYNVVYDDFLTFKTNKVYDLILANFPFSGGDAHLQKAISLLESNGGNLVCLVNAETLRNPHTNLRKALVHKLSQHGAQIEYLAQQFAYAERRTNVEVALIRVNIPKPDTVSLILDSLKRTVPVGIEDEAPTELAEALFLPALISRFNMECRAGIILIEEYFKLRPLILDALPRGGEENQYQKGIIELEVKNAHRSKGSYINCYLQGLRHKYWELLLNDPRFSSSYTSNILAELRQKLADLQNCDFNEFNIKELESELHGKLTLGVEESILKLFDELSPKFAWGDGFDEGNIHYYTGWKSNKAHKINNKVIVPINGFSAWGKDKLDWSIRERLSDMVKVFNFLSGEMHDVPRLVGDTIEQANLASNFRAIDFRYFDVTFYKKGTCHIRFKDDALLAKFNIFGSQKKGWLPPSYGTKRYADLTKDERDVIDAFQGEDAYENVVNDPQQYLKLDGPKLLGSS